MTRRWGIWATLVVLGCIGSCGDDDEVPLDATLDAPADATTGECAMSCDDGLFCNGVETCVSGACAAGVAPCDAGCDEDADECADCVDADGDGRPSAACGGNDCDDDDLNVFPGNREVCDLDSVDEDCDPSTFGDRDADGDSYEDDACCNGDVCGGDRAWGSLYRLFGRDPSGRTRERLRLRLRWGVDPRAELERARLHVPRRVRVQ